MLVSPHRTKCLSLLRAFSNSHTWGLLKITNQIWICIFISLSVTYQKGYRSSERAQWFEVRINVIVMSGSVIVVCLSSKQDPWKDSISRTATAHQSLMIITARGWPIRTTDAGESTDSGKIPIDHVHTKLLPKVGQSSWASWSEQSSVRRLWKKSSGFSNRIFFHLQNSLFENGDFYWFGMKPGLVLLGLILLLDITYAAEGISNLILDFRNNLSTYCYVVFC